MERLQGRLKVLAGWRIVQGGNPSNFGVDLDKWADPRDYGSMAEESARLAAIVVQGEKS